jgi:hypothetical protein
MVQRIVNTDKQQDEELEWSIEQSNSELTIFHFSQVSEATKVFSEENKLGQGGFGPVYKVEKTCMGVHR